MRFQDPRRVADDAACAAPRVPRAVVYLERLGVSSIVWTLKETRDENAEFQTALQDVHLGSSVICILSTARAERSAGERDTATRHAHATREQARELLGLLHFLHITVYPFPPL